MAKTKTSFTGISTDGDLKEALLDAIQQAHQASGVVDGIVKWKLEQATGENGGFVGKKELSVTISVSNT